jgi:uncharacterized protein (DUF58 family)
MKQSRSEGLKSNKHQRLTFWIITGAVAWSLLFMLLQGGKLSAMMFTVMSILALYLLIGRWSGIREVFGTRTLLHNGTELQMNAGQSLHVRIEALMPGFWPMPYVLVHERLRRSKGDVHIHDDSFVLNWNRKGIVEYHTPPLRRGFYTFENTEFITEDIFGLFQYKGHSEMLNKFTVLPHTIELVNWNAFHRMLKGLQSFSTTTRAQKETTQINGVREFILGDRMSRVHWNATAKTGTWKSKEFERESLPKTVIVLDRLKKAYEQEDRFELGVSIAASLVKYGSKHQTSIGLFASGSDSVYFQPKQGSFQYKSMLNYLVDVEAGGELDLQASMRQYVKQFAQGTLFIIISPQKGTEMLHAVGWLNQIGMRSCVLTITKPDIPAMLMKQASDEWLRQLLNYGAAGYAINDLSQLPILLGGEMKYAK